MKSKLILVLVSMLLGCAARSTRCNQWADIQKESRYADFYCLIPYKDGSRCTRAEDHFGKHHAHSLEGDCISWRY